MVCKQTGAHTTLVGSLHMTSGEWAVVLCSLFVIRCPVTRVIFSQHFERANN